MGGRGAKAPPPPPWKFHQGKTYHNRARSGNDLHYKMTKVPTHDTLHEVFVVQKYEWVATFDAKKLNC